MSSMMSEQHTWENVMEDIGHDESVQVLKMDSALFFMELMEEDYLDDAEDDRLSCVIRSLEAEIGTSGGSNGGGGAVEMELIGMDDILSDFDSCGSLRPMGYIDHEGDGLHLDWVEMDVSGGGDIASSWCMGDDEMVGYGDPVGYYGACYVGDSSVDQVSSPLWQ